MKELKDYILDILEDFTLKKKGKIVKDTTPSDEIIDLPSEIKCYDKTWHLSISKDSDITGRSNGKYLYRYVSEDGKTLFGISGKDIKEVVPEIKKLIKAYTS